MLCIKNAAGNFPSLKRVVIKVSQNHSCTILSKIICWLVACQWNLNPKIRHTTLAAPKALHTVKQSLLVHQSWSIIYYVFPKLKIGKTSCHPSNCNTPINFSQLWSSFPFLHYWRTINRFSHLAPQGQESGNQLLVGNIDITTLTLSRQSNFRSVNWPIRHSV